MVLVIELVLFDSSRLTTLFLISFHLIHLLGKRTGYSIVQEIVTFRGTRYRIVLVQYGCCCYGGPEHRLVGRPWQRKLVGRKSGRREMPIQFHFGHSVTLFSSLYLPLCFLVFFAYCGSCQFFSALNFQEVASFARCALHAKL